LLVAAVVMGTSVLWLPGAEPAGAGDDFGRSFTARAEAQGVNIRYGIANFLVVENYIDSGGPASAALLASVGTSESFASLPYPGPIAVGYPGYVALVFGSAPPGYPLYASSTYPGTTEQNVTDPSGAYSLQSKAEERHSWGDARLTPGGGEPETSLARASSDVTSAGGKLTATATSSNEGVTIGTLSIGSIRSVSRTTYGSGDESAVTTTDLALEGGRSGDMTFSFGRDGLQVAQQGVPLPAAGGLEALNQSLAPAGISVRFVEPRVTDDGAQAASFEVIHKADVPGAGPGTFRIRFGGAASSIALGPVEGTPEYEDSTQAAPDPEVPSDANPVGIASGAGGDLSTDTAGVGSLLPGSSSPTVPISESTVGDPPSSAYGTATDLGLGGQSATPPSSGPEDGGPGQAFALPAARTVRAARDVGALSSVALVFLLGAGAAVTLLGGWRLTKRSRAWIG
jgi:hypothetical protein